MTTSDRAECFVYLQMPGTTETVACGKFVQVQAVGGGVVGAFAYGRKYRARSDAVSLDPYSLPLSADEAQTTALGGIFGALRDASPDAWGRRLIEHYTQRTDLSEIDFLLESPQDRAGALSFGRGVDPPAPQRVYNSVVDLADLLEAARQVDAGPAAGAGGTGGAGDTHHTTTLEAARFLLEHHGTSMGGARSKSVVRADDDLWIAKFPREGDRWNYAVVEAAMLALAARCGIAVPETRIETVGHRSVLLVKRFDRERADRADRAAVGADAWYRHRMVSALTVLGADDAVTNRGRWSYLLLADELRRWSSHADADRVELFRRMVFNALVSNDDDHPRNHALVAPRLDWMLAPAYDIVPNPQPGRHDRDLAMVCGVAGRRARRGNLLSGAGRFGVRLPDAVAIIDGMMATVQANWVADISAQGGTGSDIAAVSTAFVDEGFEYAEA